MKPALNSHAMVVDPANEFAVIATGAGSASSHAAQQRLSSFERIPNVIYPLIMRYLPPRDITAALRASKNCYNKKTVFFSGDCRIISRAISLWKTKFAQLAKGRKLQFSKPDLKKMCYPFDVLWLMNTTVSKTLVNSIFKRFPDLRANYFPKLNTLRLDDCKIGDEAVNVISTQQQLQTLVLMNCTSTDSLEPLNRLENLKCFNLGLKGAKDHVLQSASRLTNLTALIIEESPLITNIGLSHLERLTYLKRLYLRLMGNHRVDNAGMQSLSRLTNLEELELIGSPCITNPGLQPLSQLANLKQLNLTKGVFTEPCLQYVSRIPNLRSLNLNFCRYMSLSLDEPSSAYAYNFPELMPESAKALQRLKNLEHLSLGGCGDITNIDVYYFSWHLRKLKTLNLAGTGISCRALRFLIPLRLERLDLRCCSNLHVLEDRTFCWIFTRTTIGLQDLSKMTSLKHLDLSRNRNVTEEAAKELAHRLPQTDVIFSKAAIA